MPLLPEREQPPYRVHRHLFGWVISHNPQELYDQLRRTPVLSDAVEGYVFDAPESPLGKLAKGPQGMYVSQALDALRQSIDDVSRIVHLGLSIHDEEWRSSILRKDGSFLATIGSVAVLPQEEIHTYFHVQNKRLSADTLTSELLQENAHTVTDTEEDQARGCPFAKNQPTHPDPLFTKFIVWATDLALEAQRSEFALSRNQVNAG